MRARGIYTGKRKAARADGYDSGLEADYAQHLQARVLTGEIASFQYHPMRLKIGAGAYYTPDFLVVHMRPGERYAWLEMHECKGWMREAAAVRLKVAADRFPWFGFVLVSRRRKSDPWRLEAIAR